MRNDVDDTRQQSNSGTFRMSEGSDQWTFLISLRLDLILSCYFFSEYAIDVQRGSSTKCASFPRLTSHRFSLWAIYIFLCWLLRFRESTFGSGSPQNWMRRWLFWEGSMGSNLTTFKYNRSETNTLSTKEYKKRSVIFQTHSATQTFWRWESFSLINIKMVSENPRNTPIFWRN